MAFKLLGGTSGVEVDVDSNKNLYVRNGLPAHPSAGGWYSVTGGPAGIVAAALASDTSLVSMRFAAASSRNAYLTRFELSVSAATIGVSAGVAGVLGLQRFTTATPTAGTARTVNEMNAPLDSTSDMTDVRDNASALTVTSVVFGTELAWFRQHLCINGNMGSTYIFEPQYPVRLAAGDGIVLRTRVALAATQTFVFSYTAQWFEQ